MVGGTGVLVGGTAVGGTLVFVACGTAVSCGVAVMTFGRVAVGCCKVDTGVPAMAVRVWLGVVEASGVSCEGTGRVQATNDNTRSRLIMTNSGLADIVTSLNQ